MQTRTTTTTTERKLSKDAKQCTETERRHGSWLTDDVEKRIFVKSFWQMWWKKREMENGKLTRLPIDANANDHDDDGSARMWAMRENKGNELQAKDNTGKPSYTWPWTIGREHGRWRVGEGEGEEGSCDSSQRKWKTCDLVDRLIRGICEIVWTPIEAWLCIANKHDRSGPHPRLLSIAWWHAHAKALRFSGRLPDGDRLWCHCQCRR